jgi:hypothetical protein
MIFSDDLNGSIAMQTSLVSSMKKVNASTESIGERFLEFIKESQIWQGHYVTDCDRWRTEIIEAIHQDNSDFAGQISLSHGKQEKLLLGKLIRLLRFEEMTDRHERIAEAYEETFQWIFNDEDVDSVEEPTWSNFPKWLQAESTLYWITGKAGSGKSTLMKYIYQEPCTFSHLETWSAESSLVMAAFFFWNSGTHMQMSYKGLMQTLLHQILCRKPELTPQLLPERWETYCFFGNDLYHLTEKELRRAFDRLKIVEASTARFCLFIDGLDEFDGDHTKLISFIKDLTGSPNVKVCVSSRPWVVFQDAFELEPSLRLEELTYPDIIHFVKSTFSEDDGFSKLQKREPAYASQLLEDIAHKASGVFLWVHVVVQSLLAGLSNGDRVSDLQRRLQFLPPDLKNLYQKILDNLDPFYLEHASQLFHIIRVAEKPPSILLLSFADEELSAIIDMKFAPLTSEEKTIRVDVMERRLNSRCKGLLEVAGIMDEDPFTRTRRGCSRRFVATSTVQYLHRTVKDFIEDPKIWDWLLASRKTSYDPNFALSTACLGFLKTCGLNHCFPDFDLGQEFFDFDLSQEFFDFAMRKIWDKVEDCLGLAMLVGTEQQPVLVQLLDELDSTVSQISAHLLNLNQSSSWRTPQKLLCTDLPGRPKVSVHATAQRVLQPHWTCSMYDSPSDFAGLSFLSIAVRLDLFEYVRAKVQHGCLVKQDTGVWPLLHDCIIPAQTRCLRQLLPDKDASNGFHNRKMIELLLSNGADPNKEIPGKQITVWEQFLWQEQRNSFTRSLKNYHEGSVWRHLLEIVPLLLHAGADERAIWDRSRMISQGDSQVGGVLRECLQSNTQSWFSWPWKSTETNASRLARLISLCIGPNTMQCSIT